SLSSFAVQTSISLGIVGISGTRCWPPRRTMGVFGRKSSATYRTPVTKLCMRSWARRPSSRTSRSITRAGLSSAAPLTASGSMVTYTAPRGVPHRTSTSVTSDLDPAGQHGRALGKSGDGRVEEEHVVELAPEQAGATPDQERDHQQGH